MLGLRSRLKDTGLRLGWRLGSRVKGQGFVFGIGWVRIRIEDKGEG